MRYLVFILTAFTYSISFGQKAETPVYPGHGIFQVRQYAGEEGLLGVVSETVFQDSRGFIWVCTRGGLNQWNGRSFKTFTTDDGLAHDMVKRIREDKEGNLWIMTQGGVSVWDGKTFKNYTEDDGLNSSGAWCAAEHPDGGMVIGTSQGANLIRDDSVYQFLQIDTSSREANWVRMLNYDSSGRLWIGTQKAVWTYTDDSLKLFTKTHATIEFLEEDDGTIWIAGWRPNLMVIRGDSIEKINIGTAVNDVDVDPEGNLWFATWKKGIVKFNGERFISYGTDQGMKLNSFWGVEVDNEGSVWGASYGSGVNQLIDESFSYFTEDNGLINDFVNDIQEDSSGTLWIAVEGGVSGIQRNGNITSITEKDGLRSGKVQALSVDEDQSVWMIVYGGRDALYRYSDGKLLDPPLGGGFALYRDSDGFLWLGTDGGGAFKTKNEEILRKVKTPQVPHQRVFEIFESSEGDIWFGVDKTGIILLQNDSAHHMILPKHQMSQTVSTFAEDDRGNIWTVLNGDIFRVEFNGSQLELVDSIPAEKLPGRSAGSLLFNSPYMWVTTDEGITKFNVEQYYEGKLSWVVYGRNQGYIGTPTGALLNARNGDLLIGTNKGAIRFNEEAYRPITAEPYTYLDSVLLHGRSVDWSEMGSKIDNYTGSPRSIALSHENNHLTFKFTGLSMTAPEHLKYQYILSGFDSDWSNPTSTGEVKYSNIPPGEYTFKVRSINRDGVVDSTPAEVQIVITPPYWQTTWFLALMVILGVLTLFGAVKLWSRKLAADKKRLEKKVNERTSELRTANDQLAEKSKEVTDSIRYAQKIQEAIMPTREEFHEALPDSFILYKPKDIVAGDFYWMEQLSPDIVYFAAADCTGHGVPGAMVSVVCSNALNKALLEDKIEAPNKILERSRDVVIKRFERSDNINDGMDIALVRIDRSKMKAQYSGAFNPLWILRKGELIEIRGDKQPIGKYSGEHPFTNHEVDLRPDDLIYVFSDGFQDQFGGPKGKKFKSANMKKLIIELSTLPLADQRDELDRIFEEWRGDMEQIDDVCILGVKI